MAEDTWLEYQVMSQFQVQISDNENEQIISKDPRKVSKVTHSMSNTGRTHKYPVKYSSLAISNIGDKRNPMICGTGSCLRIWEMRKFSWKSESAPPQQAEPPNASSRDVQYSMSDYNFISRRLSKNTDLFSGTAHRHGANFEPASEKADHWWTQPLPAVQGERISVCSCRMGTSNFQAAKCPPGRPRCRG